MRAVLDTNVLVSGITGFAIETSTPGRIIRAWRAGAFELVTSPHILTELGRALTKPYFRRRLSRAQVNAAIELLSSEAVLVFPQEPVPGITPDRADDLVLAAAAAGDAAFLVTGDRELQDLHEYEAVLIVDPNQFLEILQRPSSDETDIR